MPSGWTTSGIDWTSVQTMRNSRTEDIARELYLATHERDFWVRRWTTKSSGNYSTQFPVIPTQRLENQIEFIYTTLRNWLTTDLNPVITTSYVENKAVWIDENQIPTGSDFTDTVNLGIPHWDMSQNGNLETELSLDLSFLRDYQGGLVNRVSLSDMKKVYDILNFLTKCRAYQIESNGEGTGFKNYLQNLNVSLFGSGVYQRYHSSDRFATPSEIDVYNEWASSTPTQGLGENQLVTYFQRVIANAGYFLSSNELYFQFINMNGFNTNQFTSNNFDFKMLYFDLETSNDSNPDLNIVNGINEMQTFYESLGAKCFPFPNTDMQNFPNMPTSGSVAWRNTGYLLPYADMNKEGFLKYYTEPTN